MHEVRQKEDEAGNVDQHEDGARGNVTRVGQDGFVLFSVEGERDDVGRLQLEERRTGRDTTHALLVRLKYEIDAHRGARDEGAKDKLPLGVGIYEEYHGGEKPLA